MSAPFKSLGPELFRFHVDAADRTCRSDVSKGRMKFHRSRGSLATTAFVRRLVDRW